MKSHEGGFTLIELLIYSLVFSAFALTFVYFLTTFFRVSNYQASSGELTSQANFIVQTIERQIASASILVVNDNGDDETDSALGQPWHKLVMKNHADSTSSITISTSTVSANQTDIVIQGNQATTTLNGASVTVTGLTFTKISTPPGKDVVLVNMGLKYQNGPVAERISRQFAFGVGKTSDAVFDNHMIPFTDNAHDIGTTTIKWRSLFISATTSIDGKLTWTKTATTAASPTTSILMVKQGTFSVTSTLAGNNAVTVITLTSSTIPQIGGLGTNTIFLTPPPTMDNSIIYVGSRGLAKDQGIEIAVKNISAGTISIDDVWSYFIIKGQ